MSEIPPGRCQCGCGSTTTIAVKTTASRGEIKGQPKRFVRGHSSKRVPYEYVVDNATGCWIWARYKLPSGYGTTGKQLAHRMMWERHRGPIPRGLQIDHLCRNTSCVNPEHLEPVTALVNSRRSSKTRLTGKLVQMIRELAATGWAHAEIAAAFAVDASYVSDIVARTRWGDIPDRAP